MIGSKRRENHKTAGVAIQISDELDFMTKNY